MAGEPTSARELTAHDFFEDADEETTAQVQPPEDPGETEEVPEKPGEVAPEAAPPTEVPPVTEPPPAEAPPADSNAPPMAEATPAEPPIQIPGYPPGVKPPPWKDFEQYKKDSEALAALQAQRQAEQDQQRAYMAAQQVAEQQRQAALQQQRQPQGPWTPEAGRVPSQEEYNAYYAEDPIGASNWLGLYNAQQNAAIQQQQAQLQHEIQIRDQGEQFRRQHPDYDNVLAFAQDFELKTARSLGLSSERDLQAYLENRIQEATRIAVATGKTIHQAIYDYAQSIGYTPAQAAAAAEAVAEAPAAPGQAPIDKVRAAQARQAAQATSIGPTGASVRTIGMPTKAEYEAASQEQMDEWDRVHGDGWEDKAVKGW